MPPSPPLGTARRTAAAAVVVALSVTLAGCGGSDSSAPNAAPTSSSTGQPAPPEMATELTIGTVAGAFRKPHRAVFKAHRKRLEKQVGRAVDGWFDGAFVGVHYPRARFGTAFSTFTASARRDAQRQKELMTNWRLRNRIDGVVTRKRTVTLDVLAPHGRPAGVTARVRLVFTTTGQVHRRVAVTGRLFLARDPHGVWRIFGYDVAQGVK